jgi:2-haloacid dehalogenase/putative hydrolase of the HAD superfamily
VPLPKQIRFVTFDCYGSLIDWEAGVHKAFQKEADRDGFTVNKDELIPLFISVQREIQSGSYELYAEVLRRTAVRVAKEMGWELEPSRSSFLPDSVPSWMPFRETNAQLERLRKKYEIGILANIDDKLLGATRRHFRTDLDLVVTAQQVRSYKPDEAHFKECARRIGGKRGWVHIGSGYEPDIEPCLKRRVPVIWVNRSGEKLESNQKKPTETVKNLREAAKLLKAL